MSDRELICNEDDIGGRASVTRRRASAERRLNRDEINADT